MKNILLSGLTVASIAAMLPDTALAHGGCDPPMPTQLRCKACTREPRIRSRFSRVSIAMHCKLAIACG